MTDSGTQYVGTKNRHVSMKRCMDIKSFLLIPMGKQASIFVCRKALKKSI